ncbi:MAG: manganese efflux pump MntP [Allosphingosinicella sp.]
MDAVAVSVAQGAAGRTGAARTLGIGAAFGSAQGLMPLIGWAIGTAFLPLVRSIDHWIAFLLLGFLGLRMLREAARSEDGAAGVQLAGWALLSAAIATSIDALAAGVTLPTLGLPVLLACFVIGLVTAILSALGVMLGALAGRHAGRWAETFGGVVLIGLGLKIFVHHEYFGG